jgi:hypothetical protein
MTTAVQCIDSSKPYTLAGSEPGILCFVGGGDDHYATPPWAPKWTKLKHDYRHTWPTYVIYAQSKQIRSIW